MADIVNNIIVEVDGKFYVKSHDGGNLGGPYDSKEDAKKRLQQVEYFKHMKKNSFQEIIFNLKPQIRHDTMEGKPYLVAPMVMMTEGVHNGSNGPLFYPSDELSKLPVIWNHKPVVVYHPIKGSACSPDVLSARKVGVIMNTIFEDSKLKAEAWLEESRLKIVDKRILNALNEGRMVEVSTGLFTDNEEMVGDWNGKAYTAIARNHRPDHLAILPDLKGACSIEDGAGLLRLNAENGDTVLCVDVDMDEELKKYISENQQTLSKQISILINKKGKDTNNNKLSRKDNKMEKGQIIEQLISNKETKWQETDREYLTSLTEEILEKMIPVENATDEKNVADAAAIAEEKKKKEEEAKKKEEAAAAAAKNAEQPQTVQDYVAKAPKEIQDVLTNGLSSYNKEKAKLIGVITANKKNTFTKGQLEVKNLEELQAIASLAIPPKEVSYDGQGDVDDVISNQEEPLSTPVMNFKSDKKVA